MIQVIYVGSCFAFEMGKPVLCSPVRLDFFQMTVSNFDFSCVPQKSAKFGIVLSLVGSGRLSTESRKERHIGVASAPVGRSSDGESDIKITPLSNRW